ncbi:MAG TPA: insulinase family protein [Firmicutes bacterium]|nr:insulinase family protein [Candidatus Fermentithermobacillaceae bacterium]
MDRAADPEVLSSGLVENEESFVATEIEPGLTLRCLPVKRWKTASITVVFRVPMKRETVTKLGLVPRLAARGTRELPSLTEMARFLDGHYGTKLHSNASKIGYCQILNFSVSFPTPSAIDAGSRGRWLVKELLSFVWSCAVQPRLSGDGYPPDVFAHEREEQRRDIEAIVNSRPEYAMVRLMEVLSHGDPSGLPAWGSLSDLDEVGPVDTWEAWRNSASSSPVDVYVVGVDEDILAAACSAHDWTFPALRNYRLEPEVKKRPPAVPEKMISVEDELPGSQTIVCIALYAGIDAANPRFPALLAYNGILGGFPHSKLFTEVRERASLAYFADTVINSWRGMVIATAGVQDERRKQAEDLILQQARSIALGQVSEDELEKTRKGLLRRLMSQKDSPSSLVRRSLDWIVLGGPRTDEELARMLLKVTREDVIEVAQDVKPVAVYVLRAVPNSAAGRDAS